MKTNDKVIEYPLDYDPRVLLQLVEQDPDSFTIGRRNDDLVNWFIAKRLTELPANQKPVREYVSEFDDLKNKLTAGQRSDLRAWHYDRMSSEQKITRLWSAYGWMCDGDQLQNIWISTNYRVPVNTEPML
jgi:hypothetical protein